MNKRIGTLLLSIVMVCSLLVSAVPAWAAEDDSGVTASVSTASPGSTFSVTLKVPGTTEKISDMSLKVHFDKNVFEVTEYKAPAINGMNHMQSDPEDCNKNGFFSAAYYEPSGDAKIDFDGLELTAQIRVKDGAALGNSEFYLDEHIKVGAVDEDGLPVFLITKDDFTHKTAVITITAAPKPATGITLNKSELTLVAGAVDDSLKATVTPADSTDTVVWSSDKPAVATVDPATGKVTAVAPGEAIITATAGTETATCKVTVNCGHGSFTLFPEKESNCTEKGWDAYKKCDLCGKLFDMSDNPLTGIPYRATNDDHDFNTSEWGYKEADGHAHVCSRNAAHHDTVMPHTAGPAATETTPQTCTECGFVMQAATGHVHANHLTKVDKVDATCTTDGNKEYYRCTCGKLFEDAAAATEITDHSSVVLPKTGHSYTVQNSDEAHRRSTATDCREFDTYWYTCANDATHSAKDDAAAADKFYNGKQGAHVYGSEWVDCGETGHAHKCQYHDAYDAVQPHTPDHEGGATYDYAVKCTGCGRVLEPQRENGSIRVEVPFKLTVKKTGEMDPGQETFKFAIDRFGAPTVYTLVQDTVETNGEKTYEGKFIFTISKDQAGNLSEGFVIHQVKGNAAGWTYDESIFYAMPLFVDSYDSVRGWAFFKFDEKGELEYNDPMEEIGFTNSYSAKKPVTPPAPEPPEKPVTPPAPETPKTGDGSMIAFSIAMAIVSGAALMGAALYSRRRSR